MKIEWNKVTWYSKLLALIFGFIVLGFGIYLGMAYQSYRDTQNIIQSK